MKRYMPTIFLCCVSMYALMLVACSVIPTDRNLRCEPIEGLEPATSAKMIFLGELHGTNEAPKFAGELSCNLVARRSAMLFAIEWPADMQSAFDKFFEQPTLANRSELLSHPFFALASPDGRTSVAMFALIDRLRELRANGAVVRIVLFDKSFRTQTSNDEREQILANNLRALRDTLPSNSKILVLSGNVHSRRVRGTPWNAEFESAAYRLRDLAPITFDMAYFDGTAWVCLANGECGAKPWSGNAPETTAQSKVSSFKLHSQSGSHHGTYFVGKITASRPYATK
jgi:hypothetical protein